MGCGCSRGIHTKPVVKPILATQQISWSAGLLLEGARPFICVSISMGSAGGKLQFGCAGCSIRSVCGRKERSSDQRQAWGPVNSSAILIECRLWLDVGVRKGCLVALQKLELSACPNWEGAANSRCPQPQIILRASLNNHISSRNKESVQS
jgi:hypothetical protein